MLLAEAYLKAYNEKREDSGIYSMNEYCSNVEDLATAEDIPDIMRLYFDGASSAQNEFITNVLDSVVLRSPKQSIAKIIENIEILKQEDALDCIFGLLLIFIDWNEEITDIFLDELVMAPSEKSLYFIKRLEMEVSEYDDKSYSEFLDRYHRKLRVKELGETNS